VFALSRAIDNTNMSSSQRNTNRAKQAEASAAAAARRKSSMQHFGFRSIEEQQAALNLTKLAKQEHSVGMNEHSVDALILSLAVRFFPP
jgi:hypothetical protein